MLRWSKAWSAGSAPASEPLRSGFVTFWVLDKQRLGEYRILVNFKCLLTKGGGTNKGRSRNQKEAALENPGESMKSCPDIFLLGAALALRIDFCDVLRALGLSLIYILDSRPDASNGSLQPPAHRPRSALAFKRHLLLLWRL